MVSSIASRTVFVIVASSGTLSGTFVASAAAQEQQRDSTASLAAPEPTRVSNAVSAIPTVGKFYTLLDDGKVAGLRVTFAQNADVLTAIWTNPQGETYGRGTYQWDAVTGSFKGTSTTRHLCLDNEGQPSTTVLVREELYIVNDHELRDRWTKPLAVDCSLGLMEVFRWTDQMWVATDQNWKPLGSKQESRDSVLGAR